MSEQTDVIVGDPELITKVRGGDRSAFAQLYRRHATAAGNLARQLARNRSDADDLVSEAFARVLDGLSAGKGPDTNFRAYLFTTMRHTAYDRTRSDAKISFTDDDARIDTPISDPDVVLGAAEDQLVGRAYSSLPERWQAVLWYLTVEGYTPAKTGELLGLTPNAVTSLAFRAREGLREAYLQAHLVDTDSATCRTIVGQLGAWTRDGLSRRERAIVDGHLAGCADCRTLAAELREVNSGLRALLAPVLLGGAALGYLSTLGPVTVLTKIGLLTAGGKALVGAGTVAGGAAVGSAATGATAGGVAGGGAAGGGAAVVGAAGPHPLAILAGIPKKWALAGGMAVAAAIGAVILVVSMTTHGTQVPTADTGPAVASAVSGTAAGAGRGSAGPGAADPNAAETQAPANTADVAPAPNSSASANNAATNNAATNNAATNSAATNSAATNSAATNNAAANSAAANSAAANSAATNSAATNSAATNNAATNNAATNNAATNNAATNNAATNSAAINNAANNNAFPGALPPGAGPVPNGSAGSAGNPAASNTAAVPPGQINIGPGGRPAGSTNAPNRPTGRPTAGQSPSNVPSTTTAVPTTAVPTTAVPTTAVPTTAVPTTAVPTTAVPTTAVPTTAVPTTAVPTTAPPAPITIGAAVSAGAAGGAVSIQLNLFNPSPTADAYTITLAMPEGVVALDITQQANGLRGSGRAFVADAAASSRSCTDTTCTLGLPTGKSSWTLRLSVGWKVPDGTGVRLTMDGQDVTVPLALTSPIVGVSLPNVTSVQAGKTSTSSVMRLNLAPDVVAPTDGFGSISLPRHTADGLYLSPAAASSCTVTAPADTLLTCDSSLSDSTAYGPISVTALPNATAGDAQIDVAVPDYQSPDQAEGSTRTAKASVDVEARGANDPIVMTGNLAGFSTGAGADLSHCRIGKACPLRWTIPDLLNVGPDAPQWAELSIIYQSDGVQTAAGVPILLINRGPVAWTAPPRISRIAGATLITAQVPVSDRTAALGALGPERNTVTLDTTGVELIAGGRTSIAWTVIAVAPSKDVHSVQVLPPKLVARTAAWTAGEKRFLYQIDESPPGVRNEKTRTAVLWGGTIGGDFCRKAGNCSAFPSALVSSPGGRATISVTANTEAPEQIVVGPALIQRSLTPPEGR